MDRPPIGPIDNHRQREQGVLVYPVYSRRSQGLSLGINLFPDRKRCTFDCPYCEVFPFERDKPFTQALMEAQLYGELEAAARRGIAVKDIAFSGNGEPTLSPDFFRALKVAARIRDEAAKEAALVLITNGTGLLERATFQALRQAACGPAALHIWLKLDAGTEAWYTRMAASPVPWARLIPAMTAFTGCAPVTIQTMLCAIQGRPPPPEEAAAWERLVVTLAETGAAAAWAPGQARPGVTAVQLYGKARPAPRDPWTTALAPAYLEARAAALKAALAAALVCTAPISIQVFP